MAPRYRDSFPILQVADLQRSLGFYRDLLGFEVTYSYPSDDPQFVSLAIDGGKLGVTPNNVVSSGPPLEAEGVKPPSPKEDTG